MILASVRDQTVIPRFATTSTAHYGPNGEAGETAVLVAELTAELLAFTLKQEIVSQIQHDVQAAALESLLWLAN